MAKILIIEDDVEVREYLESVLSRAGYQVLSAANGKAGVEVFAASPADLVITDIIMPEKDGIETIMDLRRRNPNLKVIAISGGGRAEPENYLHSAKLLGANKTMKKPFTNEEMLQAIRDLLP
ncbi:response regulator [bacterium DOLZORAL124_64_63]|nr:MAG: response regulator [bacterium DOLZORAL124_64_63]